MSKHLWSAGEMMKVFGISLRVLCLLIFACLSVCGMADQFDKGFDPKPKTVRFTMKPGVFARELRGSMSPFNPRENESSEEAGHGAPVQNPTQDFGGIFGTEAPPVLNGFSGANMSNSIPPDPTIAAGPTTVMIAVNSKVYVMNLNGGLLASENFSDVIPSPHNLFDPWIEYDRYSNRFICVVDCKSSDDLVSECWVVFSDDSSGLGGWTAVALNMRLDGNTQVNYWMDYPRLALTDSSVCVGGPMFPINSGSVYSKLRFLSKADLYNGGSLTWADAHHQTSGGVPDTHVVPATNWDSSGSFYAVSAKTGGSDEIVIREFADTATNFGASTTLLNTYILPVTPYDNPPDARQPGGPRLENLDCRISQANVADGDIFAIHTVKVVEPGGFGSGIKAYKIRPVTGQAPRVILDSTLSSSGEDSFYPGIRGTKDGAAVIGFCRSGPSTYASQRVTGFKFGATQIESSALLKDGTATYEVTFGGTRNRFGDYSGVAVSPADEQTAWIHGEVALVSNSWRTWVASAKYDHYQLVTTPDVTGNQGEAVLLSATVRSSYNDITVSGTSVTFKVDGVVVGTDATNASGIAYLSFSIGSLAGGNHTITATASSTSIFDPGEATANLFVRHPVTIVVPDRTATIGNSVSLRATVTRTETGSPVASELVTFRVGGSVVGTDQTDASGIATLDWTVTSAVPGDVPITAAIEGDTTLAPSSGTGNLRRQSDVNFVLDNVSGQRTSTIRFRATLTRTYDGQALANRP
ncbi:MAG: Ig-like domain-containing protein, partial [Armatimonadetes bacterium]|nr:Ig-like domain-containing protein [Armatimonadota bacterium]